MKDNYFTLYWMNGSRNIIQGPNIETAFTNAGFGGGSIKALDWYEEGIADAHYYDKSKKAWVEYEPLHIHGQDIKSHSEASLVEMFYKHRNIIVQFESKDELYLSQSIGNYAQIGWVDHLSIVYGEWYKGNYGDEFGAEEEGSHHFVAVGSQYFKPADLIKAVHVLMVRATSEYPYRVFGDSDSLEDIKASQEHF